MILQIDGKPLKTLHSSPHKTALGAVSPIPIYKHIAGINKHIYYGDRKDGEED